MTAPQANFNPQAAFIIKGALIKLDVINEDEEPTAGMMASSFFILQALLKEWEASGIHVWTEEEAILFLQQGQRKYLFGGTTPDHCADAESWTLRQLSVTAIAGATSVTLSAPAILKAGDNFGVVLDGGLAFWTRAKAAVTGVTVQLCLPLPGQASAGAFTFAYTDNILRPLRVPFARRLQYAVSGYQGGIITPLAPMLARQQFMDLPQPLTPGLVTQAYYNPAKSQGEMWVWNVPQNANYGLRFTYYRPIYDLTSIRDVPDLPTSAEWANPLIWCLAQEMLPDYSVTPQRAALIVQKATEKLEMVQGWDREPESVYFGRSSDQTRSR